MKLWSKGLTDISLKRFERVVHTSS